MKKTIALLLIILLPCAVFASQEMGQIKPLAFDDDGDLNTACRYTFSCGTTTDKATYTTSALSVANSNPHQADTRGEFGLAYFEGCIKVAQAPPDEDGDCYAYADSTPEWTVDNYYGSGSFMQGGVSLSDYATVAAAITAIGATETTLWVDADKTLAEATTFHANTEIRGLKGNIITDAGFDLVINGPLYASEGMFTGTGDYTFAGTVQAAKDMINTTGTIDFNGSFEAGVYRVFVGSGLVELSNTIIYPEWWGMTPADNGVDNALPINKAIVAAQGTSARSTVQIGSHAVYYIATTVELIDGVTLRGPSKWYGGLRASDNITMVSTNGLSYCMVEHLQLHGNDPGTNAAMIGIDVQANSHAFCIQDVKIRECYHAIQVAWDSGHIENVFCKDNHRGLYVSSIGNAINVINSKFNVGDTATYTSSRGIMLNSADAGNQSRTINIWGGTVEGHTDVGISLSAWIWNANIYGVHFESNITADIQNAGKGTSITGCEFGSDGVSNNIYETGQGTRITNNHFWTEPVAGYNINMAAGATGTIMRDNVFKNTDDGKYYNLGGTWWLIDDDGQRRQTIQTLPVDDATPAIFGDGIYGEVWKTANTVATTITAFDTITGAARGLTIKIIFGDANTTIDFTGTSLEGNAGGDWTPAANDSMICTYDGSNWYCDISDNSA